MTFWRAPDQSALSMVWRKWHVVRSLTELQLGAESYGFDLLMNDLREWGRGSPFLENLRRSLLAWPQCQAQPYALVFDSSNDIEEIIGIPLSCGEKLENVLDSAVTVMNCCEARTRKEL